MNQLEEDIKHQREYLRFLEKQIVEETKILQRIKEEQIGFIRQLKEWEKDLEGKRKEIETYWGSLQKEKGNIKAMKDDLDARMKRLEVLKKTMEETGELGKWLSSKKLIFLDKSKVVEDSNNEDNDN